MLLSAQHLHLGLIHGIGQNRVIENETHMIICIYVIMNQFIVYKLKYWNNYRDATWYIINIYDKVKHIALTD